MNKREYLNKLIDLCTEKQKDLFNRMYKDGPNIKQLPHAILQVENTLKDLNVTNEDLKQVEKDAKTAIDLANYELNNIKGLLADYLKELKDMEALVDRLRNPITNVSNEIQERLELLDALEAGGVDNWIGYDDCI